MTGTFINVAAILIGGTIGLLFGSGGMLAGIAGFHIMGQADELGGHPKGHDRC